MNTIAELTKDCPREDCSITSHGGASTCVAWTPTYDKHGNRMDKGDPNTHTSSFYCSACRAEWSASTRYGETIIRRHEPVSK